MTFVSWDWGHLAVHGLWLGAGALIGAWLMALMAIARDCDRWAEDAAASELAPASAMADDGARALARATERADFYEGLYRALIVEMSREAARR